MIRFLASIACIAFGGSVAAAPLTNFSGLWNGPEPGWGIAVDHQGPVVVAIWITYDHDGRPTWFVIPGAGEVSPAGDSPFGAATQAYAGQMYRTQSEQFAAFPTRVNASGMGTGAFRFEPAGASAFLVEGAAPRAITPFQFSSTVTVCSANGTPGAAPNYQGLWWNSPSGTESGWGLYIAHQGDTIFAILLTYNWDDGRPTWYSMALPRNQLGRFSGRIYETSGPAYDAPLFDSASVRTYETGRVNLGFSDRANGTLNMEFDDYPSALKNITRMVFSDVPTVCN